MAGKPVTNLADLTPKRTGPRPVPVASEAEAATTAPEPAETAPARRRQPGREKAVMIAGHFEPDVSFALHELLGKVTRQRGQRVTVQQAIAEGLTLFFEKHGATPPDGLTQG